MAGTNETESEPEIEKGEKAEEDCFFIWDEQSQLYYHASSGFYHDPNAGWYYNTRDGLYYKFENGDYVLMEYDQDNLLEVNPCEDPVPESSTQGEPPILDPSHGGSEAYDMETVCDEPCTRYSKQAINGACDMTTASDARIPEESISRDNLSFSVDDAGNDDAYELEEGEWVPDDNQGVNNLSTNVLDEGNDDAYELEENWRAQYGQVVKERAEETVMPFPVVDLWDWQMVRGTKKNGKGEVARLVGRLVRRSIKLHPSMPSGGGLLKTAPICDVHLDLVRVTSGQVYKLRTPGAGYLASLQTYDASNPTKNWGFPELSTESPILKPPKSHGNSESKIIVGTPVHKDAMLPEKLSVSQKNKCQAYRDRAAERRALHGGFGVGPGQKKSSFNVDTSPSMPSHEEYLIVGRPRHHKGWEGNGGNNPTQHTRVNGSREIGGTSTVSSACPEDFKAESLNLSFGAGSYARRILESMGWKEGEALGNTVKGLKEPLQAVGNKGNAGLGWDHSRSKHHQ